MLDQTKPGLSGDAATGELNLAAAGLETDERGRLTVDKNHRTNVTNIYAAGDVIGFPRLASRGVFLSS